VKTISEEGRNANIQRGLEYITFVKHSIKFLQEACSKTSWISEPSSVIVSSGAFFPETKTIKYQMKLEKSQKN